ncbi:MAG: ATP-binding cassette domain-containing protein, partial [Candidatus Kariarchaeaceae archaeon]
VPDTRRIIKTLTVEQNLTIAWRKGIRTFDERMEEIYALCPDFERFMSQKAGSLSGGQQQMLAVARALINDNDLLLIDEPTEGLSPILAKNVLDTLHKIKETRTVLLVEQNFAAAKAVGDFYYIFDDGKIAHNGKMEDLVDDHELISRYLGVNV